MKEDKKGNRFAKIVNWRELKPRAVMKVTGEDAAEFLQGQFSQDIRQGGEGAASYGFWLNRKGRVEGDAMVVRVQETWCWVFSWSLTATALQERFETYLVADDVVLDDCTADWQGWQLVGPGLAPWFESNDPLPGATRGEDYFVWTEPVSWSPEGFRVVSRVPLQWPDDWVNPADQVFERERVAQGIAAVPADLGPEDMPQEAGVDDVGVSFRKGCYLGQEVMARVHTTGRVRRKLVKVWGSGAESAPSADLWQGENKVGTLRSLVENENGGTMGLAMVNLGSVKFGESVSLGSAEGPRFEFEATAR